MEVAILYKVSTEIWPARPGDPETSVFLMSQCLRMDLRKPPQDDFETVWGPKNRAALHMHEACEKYGCPIKVCNIEP